MGRDGAEFGKLFKRDCFNPRARMGRDCTSWPSAGVVDGFNPRARMGRDCLIATYCKQTASIAVFAHRELTVL